MERRARPTQLPRSTGRRPAQVQAHPPGGSPSPVDNRAPASRDSPIDPALRANPFSEVTDPVCRLPLPTLFDRPEAVHLGDLLRIWVRPRVKIIRSHGFSRASSGAPDATRPVALCGAKLPISGRTDSRAAAPQREKKTLPGARASVSVFVCVTACVLQRGRSPRRGSGILTRFPFGCAGAVHSPRPASERPSPVP